MLRLFLALVVATTACPAVADQTFSGTIRVVDADTLWVDGTKVRLHGIDAPELGQACELADGRDWNCGGWSRQQVEQLYEGMRAVCEARDLDRYGRVVASCRVDGVDIGERLVREGIAEAYRKYSLDYVDAEKAAFFESRGLWRGRVQAPADFRAVSAPVQTAPVEGCTIKGNISGEKRIYHMPGQDFYAATRISANKGEHWFCSEAEAQAAGWRKAMR